MGRVLRLVSAMHKQLRREDVEEDIISVLGVVQDPFRHLFKAAFDLVLGCDDLIFQR